MGKRIMALLLAAILVLGGCSSKTGDKNIKEPTGQLTEQPTAEPTEQPAEKPTERPTAEPTEQPAEKPTEQPTAEPTEQPAEKPTEQPTIEPTEQPTAEPTEQPTAEPTKQPTAEPTEQPTAEPTAQPTDPPLPTSSENIPEDFYGYYKIVSLSSKGSEMLKNYFDIFEKYGIFMMTAFIGDDGYAEFITATDPDKHEKYTYDDFSLKNVDNGSELLYVYKNGILTTLEAGIFGNIKVVFVKMTEDEIQIFKNGFTAENLELANQEASAVLAEDEQFRDNEYLNYIERARRANDEQKYSELVEYSSLALFIDEVKEVLNAGHSYRMIMGKDQARLLKDGEEVDEEDPLFKAIAKYAGEDFRARYTILSSAASEYIIDIDSDMNIIKTLPPDTGSED